jgi:iron(III) transport system substrate-binding protein
MIRAAFLVVFTLLASVACDSGTPSPPVVVYAVGSDENTLTKQLAEFTDDTGIPVILVFSKSSRNVDIFMSNSGSPTPDALISNNVADIWRAADKGALRPISKGVVESSDPLLKDPDGFWIATALRRNTIGALKGETSPALPTGYDRLAGEDIRGRLCLSSSALHVNRSLIAMLINDRGVKQAERLVRAWIRNLAAPPFSSEDELVDAIRDGTCVYGILSSNPDIDDLTYFLPEQHYMDVDAIGVARHAQQAESAQHLVKWLVEKLQPRIVSEVEIDPVSIAGWLDEDARLLAERAGYH